MDSLFRFDEAERDSPNVSAWFLRNNHELGNLARSWFETIKESGPDVTELIHDNRPTACVVDAAFAYVDAFQGHVNIGFFRGADLEDPKGLLFGNGKRMRHVKLFPDKKFDALAMKELIRNAYDDMREKL